MKIGDRVRHKSGALGTIKRITNPWIFVCLDGMNTAIPYSVGSLEVIEEEGDHEPGQGNRTADEVPEL